MTETVLTETDAGNDKTDACIIDKLKRHLATIVIDPATERNDKFESEDRKYYVRAYEMLWIGCAKPVPFYDVNIRDLTTEHRHDLTGLDRNTRRFVLKQTIGRIFEDIDPDLYHNSISRVLKVRLIP